MRDRPEPSSNKKYVICSVDESELTTVDDRFIMHAVPNCLIEQMIVAGLTVGALGIIYSWRDDRADNQISPSHASVTLMTAPVKACFARCSEPFYAECVWCLVGE
jgi:hypothetical protein